MAELAHDLPFTGVAGPGVAVDVVLPEGLWLVSGVDIAPNTISAGRHWLAPDRVLVVGDVTPDGAFVSDVTDGYIVLDITGPNAAALLAMATTLPMAALSDEHCAQTQFAGVTVLLAGLPTGLRLFVERPLAGWLLAWLNVAVSALG